MKLKSLSSILTNCLIAGVYLRDARAEPIISIGAECKMFSQVADLTRLTAFLDMKNLNNVFLLPITPCKPCLAKADIASHADERGPSDVMFAARTATLGLTSSYDLYFGPNYIRINKGPTALHYLENVVEDTPHWQLLRGSRSSEYCYWSRSGRRLCHGSRWDNFFSRCGWGNNSAVTATAAVPTATLFALYVFHLRAGAAAATAGTTSAGGMGAETTRAAAADFIAIFVNHLRAGAGGPTSAASAGDFATCATGGPATGGPVQLPLAVAPATPVTAAESTGACATRGPAQLPTPSPAVAPATIAQRLGRLVRHIRQGSGSLPSLVKVQEPHSHAMISEGIIARKGLLCFQR
jgi:hypothetical protein